MMKQIFSIMRKELEIYLGSLLVIIFMGVFLGVTLFTFFNIETFFSRGIADIRPMFTWMPILLIFLLAAITMRQWSEEQRSGTMEMLLTLPIKPIQLVLGKFFAVMVIIVIALAFTLPLPISVSFLGPLDWGPVVGGYVAAILMASAYAAIGLFISSRTDNQIVALISTVLVGGLFYFVGTSDFTNLFSGSVAKILQAIGTGSRFESIERGVIDLRDLIYYLSLAAIFLAFNTISLDSKRWSSKQVNYQRKYIVTTSLITLNVMLFNIVLYPLQVLRLDLTEQKEYTISQVTKDLLNNLQEPLLIRGYFSEQTHPYLAPLVPTIEDTLKEYEIAGNDMVEVEMLDPLTDPEIEAEANQTYGISATPFQVTGKNEASVINSYFNILIRYGDQSVVLGYTDLVTIKQGSENIEVNVENLEYTLTSAIKKVVYGFQSVDSMLEALDNPVKFTLYITPSTLPSFLSEAETTVKEVAEGIAEKSNGKFTYEEVDLEDPNATVTKDTLLNDYGLQPYALSLFSSDTYYFHMLLQNGDKVQQVYPPEDITSASVEDAIETALKQSSTGFLKTVGIWSAPGIALTDYYGNSYDPVTSYDTIREVLGEEYTVSEVDLSTGVAPEGIETLVVIAPQDLGDVELYAIDQFLMRGGSLIVALTNYMPTADTMTGSLIIQPITGGLTALLENYGVKVGAELVMDPQSDVFPTYTTREVNGVSVQELNSIEYPYFIDIRTDGMDTSSAIVSGLSAVTLSWASPVDLIAEKTTNMQSSVLLKSSSGAWLRTDTEIQPDFDTYPNYGFEVDDATVGTYNLAVSLQGSFTSYFKGRATPTKTEEAAATPTTAPVGPEESTAADISQATVETSPESSRLVVFGSSEFVDDFVLNLASNISQDRVSNNLMLMQNAVSWSSEDLDLLTIRNRGSSTRLLDPLDTDEETFWEVMNYVVALILLVGFYIFWQVRKNNIKPLYLPNNSKKTNDD